MKKVIVAIDFGTSGTTYAFAFSDAKDDIICAKWNSPGEKNKTEIILDKNYKTIKFGDDCQDYLGDLRSSEEKYYHFTDIKMKLYDNETTICASNNNKIILNIEIVISKILIIMKEEALNHIKLIKSSIEDSDILWKVTVPAIWNNKSKEIMKKAAELAGIFDEKEQLLFFALEPEAAACDYVNEKTSEKDIIKPGSKYIICDIGGGTVDISTHERIYENGQIYIEEVYPPIGGNNGSTYINKKFIEKVIKTIFGVQAMNKLKEIANNPHIDEDIYTDYNILLGEIEDFKINIKDDSINESKRINCNLFQTLLNGKNIDELIQIYNQKCPESWKIKKNKGYKLYFPYQIMIDLTKEILIDKIVDHIEEILSHVPEIKNIIYAGSVSTNDFIITMIKNRLPSLKHFRSAYPSVSVVKGAVIFGIYPYIIKSRIAQFTIGVEFAERWNELKHGKREDLKYFDNIENCYMVRKCFSPIIFKNQKIEVNEIIKKNYKILSPKSDIIFYKTIFKNVIFIDEKSAIQKKKKCIEFGRTIFNVGESYDKLNRKFVIELKLGGTFIFATLKYKEIEKSIPFDFSHENN